VKVLYRDGRMEDLPLATKEDIADLLLDRIKQVWEAGS
jgi:hypothetical protein